MPDSGWFAIAAVIASAAMWIYVFWPRRKR